MSCPTHQSTGPAQEKRARAREFKRWAAIETALHALPGETRMVFQSLG